jgi:hypothetical protein
MSQVMDRRVKPTAVRFSNAGCDHTPATIIGRHGRACPGHDVVRADVRQFAVSRGCAMFEPDSRGSSLAMIAVVVDKG